MAQFVFRTHVADGREVAFYLPPDMGGPDRPLLVFIHGAFRTSAVVADWADLLRGEADVVLVDLPGHGRSPAAHPGTVEVFAELIGSGLSALFGDRAALLVGESLGGLVGFRIAARADLGPARAVLAVDPPMTTTKLWPLTENVRRYLQQHPDQENVRSVARDVFGVTEETLEERVYYPLIGDLKLPTVILTGNEPLMPFRVLGPEGPCLFDAVDEFILGNYHPGKAQVRRIEASGHLLLQNSRPDCMAIIREMMETHLVRRPLDA